MKAAHAGVTLQNVEPRRGDSPENQRAIAHRNDEADDIRHLFAICLPHFWKAEQCQHFCVVICPIPIVPVDRDLGLGYSSAYAISAG